MGATILATWKDHIIQAMNTLGGQAPYKTLYPEVKKLRLISGDSLPEAWQANIRRTIEDHSPDSANYRVSNPVFYSVSGLGGGVWALFPDFLSEETHSEKIHKVSQYDAGLEGIVKEMRYLRRSRDPRLVEKRKEFDDFTCQACSFRRKVDGKYIIEVHHLKPIGSLTEVSITSIEDLICLCPNCHRIAHSRQSAPLPIHDIRSIISR